jgi:hypothetical protein
LISSLLIEEVLVALLWLPPFLLLPHHFSPFPIALVISLPLVGIRTIVRHVTIFTTILASLFVLLPQLEPVILGVIVESFLCKP